MQAKDSKCWTCQFGICVREKVEEKLYHAGMKGMQAEENPFAQELAFDEKEDDEPSEILEHTVEQEHVKGICFWRPEGISHPTSPIVVAHVQECNRFKQG